MKIEAIEPQAIDETSSAIVDFWEKNYMKRGFKPENRKRQISAARKLIDKHHIEDIRVAVQVAGIAKLHSWSDRFESCPRSLDILTLNRGTMFERTMTFAQNNVNKKSGIRRVS